MNKYLRLLEQLRHQHGGKYGGSHGHHGASYAGRYNTASLGGLLGKFKKLIIIVVIAVVLIAIAMIVLVVMLVSWLMNRGDEVGNVTQGIGQQVQQLAENPIDLSTYIVNGQIDAARLQQTYEALPAQLQDEWLRQLDGQIQQLEGQAGVTTETIRSARQLYDSLQAAGQ